MIEGERAALPFVHIQLQNKEDGSASVCWQQKLLPLPLIASKHSSKGFISVFSAHAFIAVDSKCAKADPHRDAKAAVIPKNMTNTFSNNERRFLY